MCETLKKETIKTPQGKRVKKRHENSDQIQLLYMLWSTLWYLSRQKKHFKFMIPVYFTYIILQSGQSWKVTNILHKDVTGYVSLLPELTTLPKRVLSKGKGCPLMVKLSYSCIFSLQNNICICIYIEIVKLEGIHQKLPRKVWNTWFLFPNPKLVVSPPNYE